MDEVGKDICAAYLLLLLVHKQPEIYALRRTIWIQEYFKMHSLCIIKDLEGNNSVQITLFSCINISIDFHALQMYIIPIHYTYASVDFNFGF